MVILPFYRHWYRFDDRAWYQSRFWITLIVPVPVGKFSSGWVLICIYTVKPPPPNTVPFCFPPRGFFLLYNVYIYLYIILSVCDRIENSDRTGTGPDLNHFDRNRTGLKAKKKLNGFDRIGRIFTGFFKL